MQQRKNRAVIFFTTSLLLLLHLGINAQNAKERGKEKTAFQVADGWSEDYDVRSDVAIVYGINDAGGKFEERVASWRNKGYTVHFMTGIAWGQYQDYFTGKFDGKPHWDEGQVTRNGDTIWHGKDVPYIVPSANFINYIKTHVKRAIDAGVTGIHLEEPEFWARAGYSESFKKEWQQYYGSPWRPQHESPEATYLSSKLKYHLYYRALKEVFSYIKSYSKSVGKDVKCYVPTHSLINYASWQIVSPEASLAQLDGMDGYIAQVWTGTSREPVYFNGLRKERVFENAFLEYGSMISMTAPTKRKIFLLTDPIEDRAQTWDDYKRNYQATFTAQLLYPMVADYEVMPWPPRIYRGRFRMENSNERRPISAAYATQMQVMVNALNEMPVSANTINGSKGIGVLLSNAIMFQRFTTHQDYDDPQLSNFYGMVMPLLKKGIPVETVHIENVGNPATLKDIKVLIMSYANMKPLSADYHQHLAKWVKNGGTLVYYGRDNDPFQTVKEWWNSEGNAFTSPSQHLFQLLGISPGENNNFQTVGKGKVLVVKQDPKELVLTPSNDAQFVAQIKTAYESSRKDSKWEPKNYFLLQRGPYDIAAVLDESVNSEPLQIKGPVIDLFDPTLPVLEQKVVAPGDQAFLYNLARVDKRTNVKVLAAAARVYEEKKRANTYSFLVKSPSKTVNAMRILLPAQPKSITVKKADNSTVPVETSWHSASKTSFLQFENSSDGIRVELKW
ncbi:hypothetical protein HRG84_08610 [Flavisolibacter sp. BT320]|nr:hypothetical protein [Flavisolibacter longurius]